MSLFKLLLTSTASEAETTAAKTIAETTARVTEAISKVTDGASETGEAAKSFLESPPPAFTVTTIVVAAVLLAAAAVLTVFLIRANKRANTASEKTAPSKGSVRGVAVGKLHEQGARDYQQDCFAVSDTAMMHDRGILGVVADGMGGLSDGDKVSQAIVEAVLDGFMELQNPKTHEQALLALTIRAMTAVDRLLGPGGYRRCGSTLIMGYLRGNGFSFVSVGDSRICLYRDGELLQLNREHIYKNELALNAVNGEQTLQSVYTDKKGSGLTSFVGMGKLKHIDMPASPINVRPGDKLMLMSDGIYNAVTTAELKGALSHHAAEAAEILRGIISGKKYPDQDNYTGVIFECLAEEAPRKMPEHAPEPAPAKAEPAKKQAGDVPSTSAPEN